MNKHEFHLELAKVAIALGCPKKYKAWKVAAMDYLKALKEGN